MHAAAAVTGRGTEERAAEGAGYGTGTGVGATAPTAGMGTSAERGERETYGEKAAYGQGGTEYTGGVGGGPAYGTAVCCFWRLLVAPDASAASALDWRLDSNLLPPPPAPTRSARRATWCSR